MHRFQEKQKYYDEKDKLILELFRTNPQSAFKLMFDTYYMPLCLYAVQLTDSFSMAEDIVQDFFISFGRKNISEYCCQATQLLVLCHTEQLLLIIKEEQPRLDGRTF